MNRWVNPIEEIFRNLELLWELTIRDIESKYRYPILGFLWALLMPLSLILIFLIVFSKIIRVEVKDVPYAVYLITGIFPWTFFQSSILQATTSIMDNGSLIKKVYIPRVIIPCSVIMSNLINFIIFIVLLLIIMPFSKIKFSFFIIFLPLVILIQMFFITGLSFLFSSIYVRVRDIKYIAEIILSMFFYLTPAFYPLDLVFKLSKGFFKLYMLNPFVGLVSLYRIVLIRGFTETLSREVNIAFNIIILPAISSIIVLLVGIYIFKKSMSTFADYV